MPPYLIRFRETNGLGSCFPSLLFLMAESFCINSETYNPLRFLCVCEAAAKWDFLRYRKIKKFEASRGVGVVVFFSTIMFRLQQTRSVFLLTRVKPTINIQWKTLKRPALR